jgi:hypothetical protein
LRAACVRVPWGVHACARDTQLWAQPLGIECMACEVWALLCVCRRAAEWKSVACVTSAAYV